MRGLTRNSVVPAVGFSSVVHNGRLIFVSRLGGALVTFVTARLLVNEIGLSEFGLCETLISLAAVFSITSSVTGGLILREASMSLAKRDTAAVVDAIRIALGVSTLSGFLLAITLLLARAAILRSVASSTQPSSNYEAAIIVIAAALPVVALSEAFINLLSSLGRSGISFALGLLGTATGGVLSVCFCYLGLGVAGFALGYVAGVVLTAVLAGAICKRYLPELSFRPRFVVHRVPSRVWKYGLFLAAGGAAVLARDSADKILVATTASAEWAAMIGISQRLCAPIILVCSMVYVPTIASAAALMAQSDRTALRDLHLRISRCVAFAAGILGLVIFALHDSVCVLWIGTFTPGLSFAMYWMLFGTMLAVILTGTLSSLLKGTGQIRPELIYIVAGMVLNVIFKYFMLGWNETGTVVASAASWAISSLIFVAIAMKSEAVSRAAILESCVCAVSFVVILSAVNWCRPLAAAIQGTGIHVGVISGTGLAALAVALYVLACIFARDLVGRCAGRTYSGSGF